MTDDDAPILTDLQLAVMRVLWERGEATAVAVQEALAPERQLAQTTVATILSRLEKRGVVAHRPEGRQFVYRAVVTEREVRRSMVSQLTGMLFGGSPAALINHLLSSKEIDRGDLERVRRMIEDEESREDGRGRRDA